jgi:hypothetical protein
VAEPSTVLLVVACIRTFSSRHETFTDLRLHGHGHVFFSGVQAMLVHVFRSKSDIKRLLFVSDLFPSDFDFERAAEQPRVPLLLLPLLAVVHSYQDCIYVTLRIGLGLTHCARCAG